MKHALRIGLLAVLLLFNRQALSQDLTFLSALEDVPLMEGLQEATQDTVNFDTPSGRIVESYAVGNVTKQSVLSYYKGSLPALGWKQIAMGTFMREGEYLKISVSTQDSNVTVHFALSPKRGN
ncbi:hypothetical protein [Terasakiella sp.]|uniref:hypothetical protein n=1 Tax=Terasakiella sp. TaxID=2034861 RepID=UPI003AA8E231